MSYFYSDNDEHNSNINDVFQSKTIDVKYAIYVAMIRLVFIFICCFFFICFICTLLGYNNNDSRDLQTIVCPSPPTLCGTMELKRLGGNGKKG